MSKSGNYRVAKYIGDEFVYNVKSSITKKEATIMTNVLNKYYKDRGNTTVEYKVEKV